MAESPVSSLSSLSSEDVNDVPDTANRLSRPSFSTHTSHDGDAVAPLSKRRKTAQTPKDGKDAISFSIHDRALGYLSPDDDDDLGLSEDTEGSAPGSPSQDEFALRSEHVTTCQWYGCNIGDLGDSDELVKHVHDTHVIPKRAKYTCDWGECARKGTIHPSGYALKSHMRSHTKEKPYFCALPECDRAFTRSDALAKHHRTVHEPEGARNSTATQPIDPATGLPRKGPKIRLTKAPGARPSDAHNVITQPSMNPRNAGLDPTHPDYDPSPPNDNIQYLPAHHPVTGQPGFMITYPPDIHFTQTESEIPADQLMRLLRRQLRWAHEDTTSLKDATEKLERIKAEEWYRKERLLEHVMSSAVGGNHARKVVGHSDVITQMHNDVASIAKDLQSSAPKTPGKRGVDQQQSAASNIGGRASKHDDDRTDESSVVSAQKQKARDDDMIAVGALMGLSTASGSH